MKRKIPFNWKRAGLRTEKFSIESAKGGGLGLYAIQHLADHGIPARKCYTPYQDHVGIEVPARYSKKAKGLIL